jgi:hypothetical protein
VKINDSILSEWFHSIHFPIIFLLDQIYFTECSSSKNTNDCEILKFCFKILLYWFFLSKLSFKSSLSLYSFNSFTNRDTLFDFIFNLLSCLYHIIIIIIHNSSFYINVMFLIYIFLIRHQKFLFLNIFISLGVLWNLFFIWKFINRNVLAMVHKENVLDGVQDFTDVFTIINFISRVLNFNDE